MVLTELIMTTSLSWYDSHKLDVSKPLVPNNFIPKIWGGKTEIQHFIDTPKRLVNTLLVTCDDNLVLNKIKACLKGYSRFIDADKPNTIRIYTISPQFIENHIRRTLTANELENVDLGAEQMYTGETSQILIKSSSVKL